MLRPDPDAAEAAARVTRMNPDFVEFIEKWRRVEVEQLPHVSKDTFQIMQGRCQVLGELSRLLTPK